MRFAEEEADREFQIGMEILGPRLDTIGMPTQFAITPELGPHHVPKWEGVISVAGTVRLYAIEPGIHSVSILIDGQRSGGIPFQIIHLPADAPNEE
jgi:hypothetical protein